MNIYLLNATQTAFLPAHILVKELPVKGLIGLCNSTINSDRNEYYDYSSFCQDNHIDYISLNDYAIKDLDDESKLRNLDIDILLILSWQRLIPDWLIEHCQVGAVGSHGSPLGVSQGRGRSPQNWALLLGCPSFSYSIFWVDPGVDSGDIIDTREFRYTETDDIMTSYIKSGLAMTRMIIDNYHNGNLQRHFGIPQNDDKAYYFPQRTREDGMIDWSRPARLIYDFVRALAKPYPGAFTVLDGRPVTIWSGRYIDSDETNLIASDPGQVLLIYPNGELLITCGDGLFLATAYETGVDTVISGGARFTSTCLEAQLQNIVDRHSNKYSYPVSPLITNLLTSQNGGENQ